MNQNNSSNSKLKVREDIDDYISHTKDGGLYLHKESLAYDENGKFISTEKEVVIDLTELLPLLGIPSPVEYDVLCQVCEMVLLREEATPGSMFSVEK